MTTQPARKRPRLWLVICLAGCALLFGVLAIPGQKPVPEYRGKTVTEWIFLLDPDVTKQKQHDEAVVALQRIGAAALPEIERILRRQPGSWREKLRDLAVRVHLLAWEQPALAEKQFRASRAAYELAELADVDISDLIPLLTYHFTNSSYAEVENARALADAGPAGISVLTNLLATGSLRVRSQAAWAMHLVPNRPGVNEALVRAANSDPDSRLRGEVLFYFPRKGGPTNLLAPVALRFIRSEDPYQRWPAAEVLASYIGADGARTALEGALNDPDQRVRSVARRALNITEPDAKTREHPSRRSSGRTSFGKIPNLIPNCTPAWVFSAFTVAAGRTPSPYSGPHGTGWSQPACSSTVRGDRWRFAASILEAR
jgi:hypothetical protein